MVVLFGVMVLGLGLVANAQEKKDPSWDTPSWTKTSWSRNNPMSFLENVVDKANENDEVQNTDLDGISSKACNELWVDGRFTFSKTLCYIKNNIKDYLDYMLYFWLTIATILIIRNGFQLVTAQDGSKQIEKFKKNMIYIVIWVVLLISFYYIIDIFISVVNLVGEV